MKCAQCGKGFSCGCQKTKAPNGQTVHKSCLSAYVSAGQMNKPKGDSLTNTINRAKQNLR